jgi:NAD(P) transhydrogenase subunit alpha
MMTTPSGTISPSRVFIIGVGVAGLQAIATAKRLGARVEAFDTRPAVEDQVKSLGAKFIKIDLGEMGETKDGYAKELTSEQLQKQRDAMLKACKQADLIITTAQLFGKKAPILLTSSMVSGLKPNTVIVDMAVETGGNVEGSKLNELVQTSNGVKILGKGNLAGFIPENASQMFSANLFNFVSHFWDKENKKWPKNYGEEILQACIVSNLPK